MDFASKSMRELQGRIHEANLLVQSWEKSPPVADENVLSPAKMLRAILESCDLYRKATKEAMKEIKAASTKYSKRRPQIRRIVAYSEIAKIDAKIMSFLDQIDKQATEIGMQEIALKECLDKLGQKSPHLLPERTGKI